VRRRRGHGEGTARGRGGGVCMCGGGVWKGRAVTTRPPKKIVSDRVQRGMEAVRGPPHVGEEEPGLSVEGVSGRSS
jgi:hypothetical protein